jgi:ABC-type branched-subunit amino acid transport system substrate-binding protein
MRCRLVIVGLLGLAACRPKTEDPNAIRVGLLLPFTGASASEGRNYERAALMVLKSVNDAGGICGRKLHLVTGDTHSNAATTMAQAQALLDRDVVAMLGPESDEVATQLLPLLRDQQVVFISPVIGSGRPVTVDKSAPWFRLAPSPVKMGQSLATQLFSDGLQNISVAASSSTYDAAFAESLVHRFVAVGGTVGINLTIPESMSHTHEAAALVQAGGQAIVMLAPPRLGAQLATALSIASPSLHPRWYLGPLLRTDALIQNTLPHALDGAVGITPKILESRQGYAALFAKVPGDVPLDGAYFYHDATAILSMALEKACGQNKDIEYGALRDAITLLSKSTGEFIGWKDVVAGVQGVREKRSVYYSGLVGPLNFDEAGERANGLTELWRIEDNAVVYDKN